MKIILVPVDLSLQSYHSAQFGLELACKLGTSVLLLHVAPPSPSAQILGIPMVGSDNTNGNLYDQLNADLQQFEDDLNEYKREEGLTGVKISTRTVMGLPAECILEAARSEHPTFAVMGTVGASNAWDKRVGSVASAVAQEITCPLWILPSALRLNCLRKFAYFAELAGNEASCIDQVVDLGERLRAKVNAVHIAFEEKDFLVAEAITEMFEVSYAHKRITFKNLMYESLGEGIEAYVKHYWPDAIILAHSERGMIARLFHHSMIRHLALTTRRPLLIIRKQPS